MQSRLSIAGDLHPVTLISKQRHQQRRQLPVVLDEQYVGSYWCT